MPKFHDSKNGLIAVGKARDVFEWLNRVNDRNPGATLKEWLMIGREDN